LQKGSAICAGPYFYYNRRSDLTFFTKKRGSLKNDVLSGITVALALVPEAVAFSFVAGVDPQVGLFSAFMVGLIAATIGGRPGMISGATGAIAVVVAPLVASHGVEYLFAAIVLAGVIQVGVGLMRWGKFIRLVPHSVMLGFVNGLAIIIFLSQFEAFKVEGADGHHEWISGLSLIVVLALIALTMAITHYLPRLTKAVPAALAAIAICTFASMGLEHFFGIHDRCRNGRRLTGRRVPAIPRASDSIRMDHAKDFDDLRPTRCCRGFDRIIDDLDLD
jgi:SulP family sulfate permease